MYVSEFTMPRALWQGTVFMWMNTTTNARSKDAGTDIRRRFTSQISQPNLSNDLLKSNCVYNFYDPYVIVLSGQK